MLTLIASVSILAQSELIPLSGPDELDGGRTIATAGDRVLMDHVGRLVVRDAATGAILQEIDATLPQPDLVTVSEDNNTVFLVKRRGPQRTRISGFQLSPFVELPEILHENLFDVTGLELNADASRLLVQTSGSISRSWATVYDKTTAGLIVDKQFAELPFNSDIWATFLGDGRSVAVITGDNEPQLLEIMDGDTGDILSSVSVPGQFVNFSRTGFPRVGAVANEDRTMVVLRGVEQVSGTAPYVHTFTAWSLPGLQQQGVTVSVQGPFNELATWAHHFPTQSVYGQTGEGLVRLDMVTGQVTVIEPDPGVTNAAFATASGIVFLDSEGKLKVVDPAAGAIVATLDTRLAEEGSLGLPSEFSVAHDQGEPLVAVRSMARSLYSVVRVDGAQSAFLGRFLEGRPTDADPGFHVAQVPGSGDLLVASEPNGNLRRVVDGVETDFLQVGEEPEEVLALSDRWAVLRCAGDDSLQLVDLLTFTLSDELFLAEPPRELDVENGRLWVRVNQPAPTLLGFDLSAGTFALTGQVPLAGHDPVDTKIAWQRQSVAVDEARALAYVASGPTGIIQRVDLASGSTLEQVDLQEVDVLPHLALSPSGSGLMCSLQFGSAARLAYLPLPASQLMASWSFTFAEGEDLGCVEFVDDDVCLLAATRRPFLRAVDGVLLGPPYSAPLSATDMDRVGEFMLTHGPTSSAGISMETALYRTTGLNLLLVGALGSTGLANRGVFDEAECVVYRGERDLQEGDGLEAVSCQQPFIDEFCLPARANSTGSPARLDLEGQPFLGAGGFQVVARNLAPLGSPGYLITSDGLGPRTVPPGSIGWLCLQGRIGRFVQQVQNADASGTMTFDVDPSAIPLFMGATAIQSGERWFYQLWYRDTLGGVPRSIFSSALAVTFN
ncbi:MAG: hypothetical protein AAGG01_08970 [Planctomycetota bacterium]